MIISFFFYSIKEVKYIGNFLFFFPFLMLDEFCPSGISSTWPRRLIFLFVSTVSWEFFLLRLWSVAFVDSSTHHLKGSTLTPLSIAKYNFTHQFPRPILLANQHSYA